MIANGGNFLHINLRILKLLSRISKQELLNDTDYIFHILH